MYPVEDWPCKAMGTKSNCPVHLDDALADVFPREPLTFATFLDSSLDTPDLFRHYDQQYSSSSMSSSSRSTSSAIDSDTPPQESCGDVVSIITPPTNHSPRILMSPCWPAKSAEADDTHSNVTTHLQSPPALPATSWPVDEEVLQPTKLDHCHHKVDSDEHSDKNGCGSEDRDDYQEIDGDEIEVEVEVEVEVEIEVEGEEDSECEFVEKSTGKGPGIGDSGFLDLNSPSPSQKRVRVSHARAAKKQRLSVDPNPTAPITPSTPLSKAPTSTQNTEETDSQEEVVCKYYNHTLKKFCNETVALTKSDSLVRHNAIHCREESIALLTDWGHGIPVTVMSKRKLVISIVQDIRYGGPNKTKLQCGINHDMRIIDGNFEEVSDDHLTALRDAFDANSGNPRALSPELSRNFQAIAWYYAQYHANIRFTCAHLDCWKSTPKENPEGTTSGEGFVRWSWARTDQTARHNKIYHPDDPKDPVIITGLYTGLTFEPFSFWLEQLSLALKDQNQSPF